MQPNPKKGKKNIIKIYKYLEQQREVKQKQTKKKIPKSNSFCSEENMTKGGVIILFGFVVLQLAFFSAKSEARNYIVYMSQPTTKEESPKERCLRILSSVFPSKKAAEDALIYAYNVIPGFAATMTSHQAKLLKEQEEVLNVVGDEKYHLDLDKGKGRHGGIFTQSELGQ